MSETTILKTISSSGIAYLKLNRPEAMNAVNAEMRDALIDTLTAFANADSVRAAVITGAGDRAFSSGQDLEEAATFSEAGITTWLTHQRALFQALREFEKPIVAAFNGVAAGAGFQIGLLCDARVGYADMRIGQPEVRAGLASIIGSYFMSWYLPRGRNVELSLSGKLISGLEAYEWALISRLAPRAEVVEVATKIAENLAAQPPLAVALTKRRFRETTQADFDDAITAAIKANTFAYRTGLPQQKMGEFLAQRSAKDGK
ncbi:MAG: enoyl-CoA hydratase/isomerase family protein [Pseudomonadota bacterium]|nr:enoyl-CoA hydratase/isomerase family protein [Pseudomonadota bacterium]